MFYYPYLWKQFFDAYESNKALQLSEKEKEIILAILGNMEKELQHSNDEYSHAIVVSPIETLFNYSDRFYKDQFTTRKTINDDG